MTYMCWMPRHRAKTFEPGQLETLVLTLIDGRRAALQPIDEYPEALAKARAFAAEHKCQVMVLPVTALEVRNMFGIPLPQRPEPMSDEDRQLLRDCLQKVLCDSSDPDARKDAFQLLANMGEI